MDKILKYHRAKPIRLKNHPKFNERWLCDRISEDPTILGLGDVEVKDVERILPKAGRLDLLLRDLESDRRYEVEIMLGDVDASHIIRTLEYWDIERKRYPQYDHCAVIVAENITQRFLNVISLFNNTIPLIALQLDALQVEDKIVLNFVKVLDEIIPGDEEEDEYPSQGVDRAYWEKKAGHTTLPLVDECIGILKELKPNIVPKYNRQYIGQTENGSVNHFVKFIPAKRWMRAAVRVDGKQEWTDRLEDSPLEVIKGQKTRRLILRITKDDLQSNREALTEVFRAACEVEEDE